MKKVQQGFTLIELMIVIAIIGILAAIALPAYQDYTIKAKIQEAVSLSSPARTALGIACSEVALTVSGAAADHDDLGLASAYSGTYTTSVTAAGSTTGTTGTVTIVLADSELGTQVTSSTNTFVYSGACSASGMIWTDGAASTLVQKFRPKF